VTDSALQLGKHRARASRPPASIGATVVDANSARPGRAVTLVAAGLRIAPHEQRGQPSRPRSSSHA